jgi:hypothetical protein
MALRLIEGFEMGVNAADYNGGSAAAGWSFTASGSGTPDPRHTGTGKWDPDLGYGGGSYACSIPYQATVETRKLGAVSPDSDITEIVLSFALYVDAHTSGVSNGRTLLLITDPAGNDYARLVTSASGVTFSIAAEMWNGSGWQTTCSGSGFAVGTGYQLLLNMRRRTNSPYKAKIDLYRATQTTDPTKIGNGAWVSLNADRIFDRLKWEGIADTSGAGNGLTVIDSIVLWTDPDSDLASALKRWFVTSLYPTNDEANTGGTWTGHGAFPSTVASAVASYVSTDYGQCATTNADPVYLALEMRDVKGINAELPSKIEAIAGLASTGIQSNSSSGAGTTAPYIWRGGSYAPSEWDANTFNQETSSTYFWNAYGVDPTGSTWTVQTVDDASGIWWVDPDAGSNTLRMERFIIQFAWTNTRVGSATPTPGTPGPNSMVLVHDPRMVSTDAALGREQGVTTPSQMGPAIGHAYPANTNEGNLMAFHGGEAWDTDTSSQHPDPSGLHYYVTSGGGPMNTAEFAWKFAEDPDSSYRGQSDIRQEWGQHNPWSTNIEGDCLFVGTSKAFNRLLVGRYESTDYRWVIKYRDLSVADPLSWDGTSYLPSAAGFLADGLAPMKLPATSTCPYAVFWECPDGALRMAYIMSPSWLSSDDMDIWGSNDGGITWDLIQEGVLSGLFSRNVVPYYVTGDSSGDWVRISFWDYAASPQGIVTIVSSDRGATWTLVSNTPDGLDTVAADYAPNTYVLHDVVGLDTIDGAFIRVRAISSGTQMYLERGSGTDDWSRIPGSENALFQFPKTNLQGVHAFRTSNSIAALGWYTDGSRDWLALSGLLLQRDHLQDYGFTNGAGSKTAQEEWTCYSLTTNGAHKLSQNTYYAPFRGRMCWTGNRVAHVFGLYDQGNSSGSTAQSYSLVSYFGGWDRRPLKRDTAANVGMTQGLFSNVLLGHLGEPDSYGGKAYQWGTGTGTGSVSWAGDKFTLTCTVGQAKYWSRLNGSMASPPDGYMADKGVVAWTCAAANTAGFDVPSAVLYYDTPKCGVAGVFMSSSATTTHVSVHLTNQGLYVYDGAGAGATLWEDTTTDISQPRDYVLSMAQGKYINNSQTTRFFCELSHRPRGMETAWTSTGMLTLTDGHVAGKSWQSLLFGCANSPSSATGVADWYSIGFKEGEVLSMPPGFSATKDIRGAQLGPWQRHVQQGAHVSWGGGGGFKGDKFYSKVQYDYGVDQVANPSPSMVWQTNGHTTTSVIFDASVWRSTGGQTVTDRFLHNAVALVGTNFRYAHVDYCDTTGFSGGVTPATALTVDAAVFTARVTAGLTNAIEVDVTGDNLRSNAVAGWLAQYQTPTAGATHDGTVWKIAESWDNSVRLDYTNVMPSSAVVAGGTLTFFPPRMLLPYSSVSSDYASGIDARFMRVTLNAGIDNQIPADNGGFKVGRIVAGMTLPISVPLEWSHTDNEAGNVDLFTADSGARSAYVRGEPRRTVKGTSVGDVSRWRSAWRGTVRTVSKYDAHPMVLVQDSSDAASGTDSMLYGRMIESTEFDNIGWKYNGTTQRWEPVGDVSMTWEEEV